MYEREIVCECVCSLRERSTKPHKSAQIVSPDANTNAAHAGTPSRHSLSQRISAQLWPITPQQLREAARAVGGSDSIRTLFDPQSTETLVPLWAHSPRSIFSLALAMFFLATQVHLLTSQLARPMKASKLCEPTIKISLLAPTASPLIRLSFPQAHLLIYTSLPLLCSGSFSFLPTSPQQVWKISQQKSHQLGLKHGRGVSEPRLHLAGQISNSQS